MDTHTAVAYTVLGEYRKETGDNTLSVVLSTASPYKFCASVLAALGVTEIQDGTEVIHQLEEQTNFSLCTPSAKKSCREESTVYPGDRNVRYA